MESHSNPAIQPYSRVSRRPLTQLAQGGAGGASAGGFAGAGGSATSDLTVTDSTSKTMQVLLKAYGANGGSGTNGSNGGAGGAAKLILDAMSTHGAKAYGTAVGGSGGSGALWGAAGAAKAKIAVSAPGFSSYAAAVGGEGQTVGGHAVAKLKATDTSTTQTGAFDTTAQTSLAPGQIVQGVTAYAQGAVTGASGLAKSEANIGDAIFTDESGPTSLAKITGLPDASAVSSLYATYSGIGSGFGAAAVVAVGEFGGAFEAGGAASQLVIDNLYATVDLAKLKAGGSTLIGLFDPTVVGTGFSSLSLTVSLNGTQVFSQSVTSVSAAEALFNQNVVNAGALPASGVVTLKVQVRIGFDAAGQGFYGEGIIGDTAGAASASRFAQGAAGLGAAASASLRAPAPPPASLRPLIVAGGRVSAA